jgi:7,8-dihydropterin-6-yl-methyl-4-(beta-D-ribofuranosyl)aminobenzene 5'-phosphate synthase
MDITSLIDHKKAKGAVGIATEWGSSFHIKCDAVEVLFDAGSSGRCVDNAAILGIDIRAVNLAVLSHGHYDHGGGLTRFLEANEQAKIYMARGAEAGFYASFFGLKRFVGLEDTLFQQFARRIEFLDRTTQLAKGVHAILPLENLYQGPEGTGFFSAWAPPGWCGMISIMNWPLPSNQLTKWCCSPDAPIMESRMSWPPHPATCHSAEYEPFLEGFTW